MNIGNGSDLSTLAENKLDAAIAADEAANNGDDTPPAGDDTTPPNPDTNSNQDDDDDGQSQDDYQAAGDQNQDQDEEEDDQSGSADDSEDDGAQGDQAPKPLTDDELIAELEKRGLKVEKKDADDKPDADQPKPIARPEEIDEKVWGQMHPIQQHIYDQLPYLTVEGKDGAKLQVKTPDQLPDDFEFASKRAESQFNADIAAQSVKAEKMYADITQTSQAQQQQQQAAAESQAIVKDVDRLQADGIVPKIEAKPGTPEFDKDPGVLRANEILAYHRELHEKGEKVSAYSAGLMYKALHPELYQAAPKPKTADDERKRTSKVIAGKGSGTPSSASKPARRTFAPGTSAADIADSYMDLLD